ncbi:coiled-coil domain-containing protein 86 [Carcharodon carcharias]|uniref:coiled-coil domain-containing protein 86 n=1 Tax=Carcharodon carcharias TaxID=13397 RepID=UPI001B7DC924|nr:coiled-coil domain-containing protein 86 [Carcharodon carcharias]
MRSDGEPAEMAEKDGERKKITRGRGKSGRVWREPGTRFSVMLRDKPLCTTWEKKMATKRQKKAVKEMDRQLREGRRREKEEKRLRREENLRRRLENERKSEVVQVIKNPLKIKRLKKKQLRKIEKRDTLRILQKSQPQRQREKAKGPDK